MSLTTHQEELDVSDIAAHLELHDMRPDDVLRVAGIINGIHHHDGVDSTAALIERYKNDGSARDPHYHPPEAEPTPTTEPVVDRRIDPIRSLELAHASATVTQIGMGTPEHVNSNVIIFDRAS